MNGQMQPAVEMPSRAETVLERVKAVDLGPVVAPAAHGLEPVLKVHDAGYVRFLERAWDLWTAEGRDHEALPLVWAVRSEEHTYELQSLMRTSYDVFCVNKKTD